MLPYKAPLAFKRKMQFLDNSTLICVALFIIALAQITNAESRQTRTPARVLAKQTGATQFEEERYETLTDCNEHKHHLKKRASDEDIDYEVYQGVVGRPGIDFPIYPRIPKTSFSCRSFGNGYFADMETDCQVFHICEEGRKISFLCPNGTIFQQSELTCDWWFKVNCLGSPGYYAESAEILSKQRLQRVRPSVPVQGFNIVGGGLNIKPKINNKNNNNTQRPKQTNKSERRIDSSEQQPSVETVDFDDLSGEKSVKGPARKVISNIDDNNNDNESQIIAETASFVGGRNRNNYAYEKPNEFHRRVHNPDSNSDQKETDKHKNYSNPPSTNTESSERARNGQRGQQRFKDDKKPAFESFNTKSSSSNNDNDEKKSGSIKKNVLPEKVIGIETSGRNIGGKADITAETEVQPEYYEGTNRVTQRTTSTTAQQQHSQGTYSTARKLDNTRTTPYYTPTVPSVVKSKTTEGKSYYVKGKGGNVIATTPNSNRLNGNNAGSGLFLESSSPPRTTTTTSQESFISTIGTTFRPFIIGMRHSHEDDVSSAELHHLSLGSNKPLNINDLPVNKLSNNKRSESREYLPTTTPATTGPTYLPKTALAPKGTAAAAGDDIELFAPNPVIDDSVSRNLDEMLKTMNLLKSKLSSSEDIKGTGPARSGLDIPPSSGPDVLISLAKYFAAEQANNNANLLTYTDADAKKTNEKQGVNTHSSGSKPSDTTATLTTAATPRVNVKTGDIKNSLLSERTVDRYTSLFGLNGDFKIKTLNLKEDERANKTNLNGSKDVINTPFPQIGSTDSTIRQLAQNPGSRPIAQVFSNALSTYLEDPKTFRQQLESVRPTEPSTTTAAAARADSVNNKHNFIPVTSKDNLLFKSGTAASYLPTKPTSPKKLVSTTITPTTENNIAVEINDKFDYSTQFPDLTSTTEIETTTYRPAFKKKSQLELSAELSPTTPESGEAEEFLHREQTQSFVKSRNQITTTQGSSKKASKTIGEYSSTVKSTENPWNSISQTDFLDPLTINDGLMKETKTTTVNPFTYQPKETTTTTQHYTAVRGKLQELSSQGRNIGSRFSIGSTEVTTQRNQRYQSTQETDSWHDILQTYDLPLDTLPSSNGLQRIANRLFGGLNESEALHLKNVMQQAEHNRQVLRLLLLLIQTCDDQNGKALERSRKHLLNALIDMDSKLQAENKGKVSYQKGNNNAGTTTYATIPTTTTQSKVAANNRRTDINNNGGTSTFSYPTTTTDLPSTTTTTGSIEETTKFEIRVPDPEDDQISTASTITANSHTSSDQRALELLKSLYSLASKFTTNSR